MTLSDEPSDGHNANPNEPQDPSKPTLQYYYHPNMRCSAISLDINNLPPRSKTFQDMLDEGDGKEGDLNQRYRNERWKDFDCLSGPPKKRRGTISRSNGVVSANDLAAMRRSAGRMANSNFKTNGISSSFAALTPNTSRSGQDSLDRAEAALKRSYTESLLGTRVYPVSAGLAYGSKHIQMLKSCKN